jgi:hypothetical protein
MFYSVHCRLSQTLLMSGEGVSQVVVSRKSIKGITVFKCNVQLGLRPVGTKITFVWKV